MIPSAALGRTPVNIISRSSQRQEAAPAPDRFSLIDRTSPHLPPAAPDPQHGGAPTGTGAGCPHRARAAPNRPRQFAYWVHSHNAPCRMETAGAVWSRVSYSRTTPAPGIVTGRAVWRHVCTNNTADTAALGAGACI